MFLAHACQSLATRGGAESSDPDGQNHPSIFARVVDHGLRPESSADAERAVELLTDMGYDAKVLRLAHPAGKNEADWRRFRYQLLADEALILGASLVLTAHTADDSAETILMRLMRGTGIRGLAGIPARRSLAQGIDLYRPMLHLRADDVREALVDAGQEWVEDLSNADSTVAVRNFLRHEVMPGLEHLATGDPILALNRLAAEVEDWQESLGALLLQAETDWRGLPSYLRRQAVAKHLRDLGETVSPTRLLNLEGALARNGSAAINETHRLSISGGGLSLRAR